MTTIIRFGKSNLVDKCLVSKPGAGGSKKATITGWCHPQDKYNYNTYVAPSIHDTLVAVKRLFTLHFSTKVSKGSRQ